MSPPLRSFLLPLFLFPSFYVVEAIPPPMKYDSLSTCAKKILQEQMPVRHVTSRSHVAKQGEVFTVVGLSWNCVFYMAYVHHLMDRSHKTDAKGTIPSDPSLQMRCRQHKAFLVETQGVKETMAIIVSQYGKRMAVQNAMGGRIINRTNDALYMEVDIFNRKEHIFTNPVGKGYQILRYFNADYRIFVVARNHFHLRLYELVVMITKENTMIAYLRKDTIDFDPLIADPTDDRVVESMPHLDASAHFDDDTEFETKAKRKRKFVKNYDDVTGDDLKNVQGFAVHKRVYHGEVQLMLSGTAIAVPLISLLNSHYRGVERLDGYTEQVWSEKEGRFFMKLHPCMLPLHQAVVYTRRIERGLSPSYLVPTADTLAYMISNTRYWGENNHRRMTYPNVQMTVKKRKTSIRTTIVLTLFSGAIIAILIFACVSSCVYNNYQRKKGRGRHSVGSFNFSN